MPDYRVRTPFRIAAALPGLLFVPGGVVLMLASLAGLRVSPGATLIGALLGALSLLLGGVFLRVFWTGRVPAFIEEYGMDDPSEIEAMRAGERTRWPVE